MAKYVLTDAYVEYDGVDKSNQFSQVTITTSRDQIDASVFGDRSMRYEKGVFTNGVQLQLRPDADFAFVTEITGDYAADVAIPMVVRFKNAAKADSNPELSFNVQVTQVPFGGTRNQLFEGSVSWPIDGPITYDYDTSTITLG